MGSSSAPDEKMDMGVHSAAGIVKPEGVADREGPQSSSDPHAQNGANAANTAGARLKRVIRKPRRVAIECCPVSPLAKKEGKICQAVVVLVCCRAVYRHGVESVGTELFAFLLLTFIAMSCSPYVPLCPLYRRSADAGLLLGCTSLPVTIASLLLLVPPNEDPETVSPALERTLFHLRLAVTLSGIALAEGVRGGGLWGSKRRGWGHAGPSLLVLLLGLLSSFRFPWAHHLTAPAVAGLGTFLLRGVLVGMRGSFTLGEATLVSGAISLLVADTSAFAASKLLGVSSLLARDLQDVDIAVQCLLVGTILTAAVMWHYVFQGEGARREQARREGEGGSREGAGREGGGSGQQPLTYRDLLRKERGEEQEELRTQLAEREREMAALQAQLDSQMNGEKGDGSTAAAAAAAGKGGGGGGGGGGAAAAAAGTSAGTGEGGGGATGGGGGVEGDSSSKRVAGATGEGEGKEGKEGEGERGRGFGFALRLALAIGILCLPLASALLEEHLLIWVGYHLWEKTSRLSLLAYWLLLMAVVLFSWPPRSVRLPRTILRKGYHVLAFLLFAPGQMLESSTLRLAYAASFALLVTLELVRAARLGPLSQALQRFIAPQIDHRDAGPLALTHIYLLLGCAIPSWLTPHAASASSSSLAPLAPLAGVLILGVGDTAASVWGTLAGSRRWVPGATRGKTVEGTAAGAASTILAAVVALAITGKTSGLVGGALLVFPATIGTCLLEAFTEQIDNLVLPVWYFATLAALSY